MILTQVSLSVLPPSRVPSDKGQDAVDEQGHDGSAEQASHGHCDEPRQEDVPEEAPVHCFMGANPTHGHNRTHLEGAAKKEKPSAAAQNKMFQVAKSKTVWRAAGCSGFP